MKLQSRVDRLERTSKPSTVTCTIRRLLSPGPEGPVDRGLRQISIVGGKTFSSRDYATEATLLAAADQEHRGVHGTPMTETSEGDAT